MAFCHNSPSFNLILISYGLVPARTPLVDCSILQGYYGILKRDHKYTSKGIQAGLVRVSYGYLPYQTRTKPVGNPPKTRFKYTLGLFLVPD